MTVQHIELLLPIKRTFKQGLTHSSVNARDLWLFVESKQEFANWIKNRIKEGLFKKGTDFEIVNNLCPINLSSKKRTDNRGGHNQKDYLLSLSMAKEIAMLERNAQGKLARQYFIQCEETLQHIAPDVALQLTEQWKETRQLARTNYLKMCNALQRNRQRQGKDTPKHIFSNESEMLTSIVVGMSAKKWREIHNIKSSLRESLNEIQLEQLDYLEGADQILLDMKINDFYQRKEMLTELFQNRYSLA